MQRCRTLPDARNRATGAALAVPCVELSFALSEAADLTEVLTALCAAHADAEPVIHVTRSLRTRHRRGTGEDAPAWFWIRPAEDRIPQAHRG